MNSEIETKIHSYLSSVNGKRKCRTLTMEDVIYVIKNAQNAPNGHSWILPNDMVVANAYGYKSYATLAQAIKLIGENKTVVNIRLVDGRRKTAEKDYEEARNGKLVLTKEEVESLNL